jgi:hypothetical protein
VNQITVTPTPPVQPPCTVEICVPRAGTLTLKWSHEPTEMAFTKDELCRKLEIPADCQGLVIEFPGCQAVNVV